MVDSQLISLAGTTKIHTNKTLLYIAPCLNTKGEKFTQTLRKFKILGVFVEDLVRDKLLDYTITVVSNPAQHQGVYMEDFDYITNYAVDYYNRNNLNYFVFDIPERFHSAYLYFLQGKYSKMYTKQDAKELFPLEKPIRLRMNQKVHKVINKDEEWKKAFEKMINSMSKDDYPPTRIRLDKNNELDFLPNPKDEVIFKEFFHGS